MNEENIDGKKIETTEINKDDISEKNEDLLNVDYREFYDELAPHGEWIKVTDKDIGLDMKKETSSNGISSGRSISLSSLFGIKDAYANDVAFGAFFIWRPSPNLAVSITAGEPAPYYVPYANGQWIYTDAGWYFLAPTPYEEIVHHYGRWIYTEPLGWVWIPGRVWAPAWVEWRENDDYIAWTPVPPCIYIEHNVIYSPVIYEDRYIVVDNSHFCDPLVYNYRYRDRGFKITEMRRVDGIVVKNGRIYNNGPEVKTIEHFRGSKIDMLKINKVKSIHDIRHTNSDVFSYSPDFKRIKNNDHNGKSSVFKPGSFKSFSEVNNKGSVKNGEYSGKKDKSGSNNSMEKHEYKGNNSSGNHISKGSQGNEKHYSPTRKNRDNNYSGSNHRNNFNKPDRKNNYNKGHSNQKDRNNRNNNFDGHGKNKDIPREKTYDNKRNNDGNRHESGNSNSKGQNDKGQNRHKR